MRLHGIKDYLDMVAMLEKYPKIHQTFNLVPSLIEQIEDYAGKRSKDKFLELSYRPAAELNSQEKEFIFNNFFKINPEKCIAVHPRYYELYSKKKAKKEFNTQDYLDLQVWFNLAWFDPDFRKSIPELSRLVLKARFFSEEDKRAVLEKQFSVLAEVMPNYKKFAASGQIEVTLSPYYHPILPLLCNINIAKEANHKVVLPQIQFSYPQDAKAQINQGVELYEKYFGAKPRGMWPSEESVSQQILPSIIEAGINWIVADEAILFKSLKLKKREPALLYQPHLLKREEGDLNIVFRDRNLSDLLGFVYQRWEPKAAVDDFMKHIKNISGIAKDKDILVTLAMDGENAWEYYSNDGHDFLEALYQSISAVDFVKAITVSEYLKDHPAKNEIFHLAAGSWIYAEFAKWIGSAKKNKAWEYLAKARQELEESKGKIDGQNLALAWKQIYILEGSDWFWWYGDDDTGDFDKLYRMHMINFYTIIGKQPPDYLSSSL